MTQYIPPFPTVRVDRPHLSEYSQRTVGLSTWSTRPASATFCPFELLVTRNRQTRRGT